ncbi:unnamed protein product [Sphagnum troendelagicum]|uniref:C2H2-type domain-containing protein n=1 Tax=Sphagnum troendelagicum TaxID=128251 RepID=A0ABP0UWY3_9BRYO
MDLPVFTSHSLVSTPAAGLERVAVEGGSALRNIANNYVEEGEGSSSSEEQGVTENGHHGQEEKDIDYGRLLWHASVHEGGKSICQNHIAEDALTSITKLENSAVMSGDKLSKNGLDKPENERETNLIRPTALVTERGLVCLENGVAKHMDKEARQTISCEQGDGGNERSGTLIAPGNCHVETTEDAELSEEEDEHHIEDREGNAAAGEVFGGTLGFDEKSLIKSQSCPCTESGDVASPAPIYFCRRKGCGGGPLGFDGHQASCFLAAAAAPHTPQFEEPRAVRCNRGIKRRFPGDESDDCLPKHIRVRSIASVYGNVSQPIEGKDADFDGGMKSAPMQKHVRLRKSGIPEHLLPPPQEDQNEEQSPAATLWNRSSVEAVSQLEGSKCPGLGRNGQMFACNINGCNKRFKEAVALYAHARVHGDRPYICHYDGCIKSFSEKSKLKRHFLIHTGEKPFPCLYEGCGKAFSLDFNLRSHMKTHTGDYHECPYDGCQKHYCQEYKLRAHISKEHSWLTRGVVAKFTTCAGSNTKAGAKGCISQDATRAVKKRGELLADLELQLARLRKLKEERVNRIVELDEKREREIRGLTHTEQELEKLDRDRRLLEED